MVETVFLQRACRHPLGLAAGPDRGGAGLQEAITAGFSFIETGTVTAQPEAGHNPGAIVLAQRIGQLDAHPQCIIGVNIGSQFAAPVESVGQQWVAALAPLAARVQFVTINLSAPYYAHLLEEAHRDALLTALDVLTQARPVALPLLVKLPFGRPADQHVLPGLLSQLRDAGIHGVVVSSVPEAQAEAAAHIRMARQVSGLPVIATGGVRTVADLADRQAAGAALVEVYTLFAQGGAQAIYPLFNKGFPPP